MKAGRTDRSRRDFLRDSFLWTAAASLTGCVTDGNPTAGTPVSAEDEVRRSLDRIERLDRRGPSLHSVVSVDPSARNVAREQDRRRREGTAGPLSGFALLVKDNIDTTGPLPTTGGSLALAGTFALADAPVAARLRSAGAVILGKSNLSEWANFRSSRSVSGWSAVGGQTRNPHALARTPWGSSSGSGVAVAAGLCTAAIGTETNGSIIAPASVCSVVGLKPTVGLVSRTGIIPIAVSQDTAGPMARTIRDAALLLEAIAGLDPRDPDTAEADSRARGGYLRFLRTDALRGRRIGVARDFFGYHPETDRLIESHFGILRELGAELVDPVEIPDLRSIHEGNFTVMLHEFRTGLAAYLATRDGKVGVRTLADVIAFNERNADQELAVFDQDTFLRAEKTPPLGEAEHHRLRDRCRQRAREKCLGETLAKHRLDALIAPSGAPASYIDPVNRDHFIGGCTSLPAIGGCPHLTVPAGGVRGLPVGLSFIGAPWTEGDLLGFGFAFEQATRARLEPRFLQDVPMAGTA